MLPGFFHCPGAIKTQNKIVLLTVLGAFIISTDTTEKGWELYAQGLKCSTDTKLSVEERGEPPAHYFWPLASRAWKRPSELRRPHLCRHVTARKPRAVSHRTRFPVSRPALLWGVIRPRLQGLLHQKRPGQTDPRFPWWARRTGCLLPGPSHFFCPGPNTRCDTMWQNLDFRPRFWVLKQSAAPGHL